MTERKQSIGDISRSKDVDLSQSAAKDGEQVIGNIADSERVRIAQEISNAETSDLLELGNWLLSLSHEERLEVATRIREELIREAGDQTVDGRELERVATEDLPDKIRKSQVGEAIRDAASAVSLVSGSVAIGVVTNPLLLAIAVPLALTVTGILQKDQLKALFGKFQGFRRSAQ